MNWNKDYTYSGTAETKLNVTITTTKTDIEKNQTEERVVVKFIHTGSSWSYNNYTASLNFNGTPRTKSFNYSGAGTITLFDFKQLVTHNTDGSKKVSFSISDNRNNMPYTGSVSGSATITLDTIPRYTRINTFTITNATLNSLRVNWATADTVNRVQYQIGSGAWTNGYNNSTGAKKGNFTLSGLSPNTEYTIKIRARRKDSGLDTTSGGKKGKTLNIARFTDVPDNVDISKPFTVKFNRNDAKTVEVGIYNTSKKAFAQYVTVTGTSHTFDLTKKISPDDTRTPAERMYDDMPNTNSKQYLVYIATNGNTYRDSVARTFKIVGTHPSNPVFTQKDTNSYIVTKLTGNDQIFIQNYSDLQVDITTATPFRGSTIKKYIVINGSNTKTYTSSGVKNIGKVQAQQLQVIVQDSRGNRSQLIRQLDYIPYTQPIIQNFNLDREIGTSTSADLVTNGLYTAVDFGAVNNSITKVEYRSKTTGEYGSWTDITGLVLYGSGTFNNSTNTQLTGFTFGTAYTVELKVTDKLGFNTLTTTVSKGMFTMLIDQEYGSVGIGKIPRKEENSLDIEGNVYTPNLMNKKFLPRAETTNLDFDKTEDEWGTIRHDIVTRQVTQGKPMGDGFVTTYFWDNSGKFDSQLYIPNGDSRRPQWRSRSNKDEWGEWINIYPETIIDGDRQAIKFPDGTLICSARYFATNTPADMPMSGNVAYKSEVIALPDFLVEFTGIPSITYGVQQNITANRLIGVYPQAMVMSTLRPPFVFIGSHGGSLTGYGTADCPIISYQAIGRWK